MTESELLEAVKRARQALSLASWEIAHSLAPSGQPAPTSTGRSFEDAPLAGALQRFRQARRALVKAFGRWQHRAHLIKTHTPCETRGVPEASSLTPTPVELDTCVGGVAGANREKLAPTEAL